MNINDIKMLLKSSKLVEKEVSELKNLVSGIGDNDLKNIKNLLSPSKEDEMHHLKKIIEEQRENISLLGSENNRLNYENLKLKELISKLTEKLNLLEISKLENIDNDKLVSTNSISFLSIELSIPFFCKWFIC